MFLNSFLAWMLSKGFVAQSKKKMGRLLSHPSFQKRFFQSLLVLLVLGLLFALYRLERMIYELSQDIASSYEYAGQIAFFVTINLNVLIILVLVGLIYRALAKSIIESRSRVLGGRLRTKLILVFVTFAIVPSLLTFLLSVRYIHNSFDNWISQNIEKTIAQTKIASEEIYERDQKRLEGLAQQAADLVRIKSEGFIPQFPLDLPPLQSEAVERFCERYGIVNAILMRRDKEVILNRGDHDLQVMSSLIDQSFYEFETQEGLNAYSKAYLDQDQDAVVGFGVARDKMGTVVAVVAVEERFDTRLLKNTEDISKRFSNLKAVSKLSRLGFIGLLLLVLVIVVFSMVWIGLNLAKSIVEPIQELVEATSKISRGDYSFRLQSKTKDETSKLMRAFTKMANRLKSHEEDQQKYTQKLRVTNAELKRRQDYMEIVLKNITSGVISVDASGKLTSMNRAAERLLQCDAQALIGKPVELFPAKEFVEKMWLPLSQVTQSHRAFFDEIELEEQNIRLIVAGSRIANEFEEDLGTVVVFDDATEQSKIQRMSAWREVARRIAHEIKNPITPIKLSAQRLLRRYGSNYSGYDREVFENCIETILSQVDSLRDLVNEFSKFSRLPEIKVKKEKLEEVVKKVTQFYQISYPQIKISLKVKSKLPQVMIDKEQMSRVFSNLISNSVEAFGTEANDQNKIEISMNYIDNLRVVRVLIKDNGPGIDPAIRDRIFDPYISTKETGTGLGLSIVHQIIAEHQGYIRFEALAPKGTCVTVDIPKV